MKKPLLYSIRNRLFRIKVHFSTNTSILRICMIFLLYCTAITFFLMGVNLFFEEQKLEKTVQNRVVKAAAANTASHSVLYAAKEKKLQRGIAENVIRLHVIANSDSKGDQTLKLSVRDAIIEELQNCLKNTDSQKKAEEKIASCLVQIEKTATDVLRREGKSDSIKVSLADRMFPVKQYGDLTFPAGMYRALCVEIGEAAGHNWWCVLFPSLCFVNETTAVVPENAKEKLKESLTEEEYELLEKEPEPRSLIYDWISGK